MIQNIPEYEYLGNSLKKINSNWKELNIRLDNLFSEAKAKHNAIANTFLTLSSDLAGFLSITSSTSANWKAAADLVYNAQGHWEQPVSIIYQNTFNGVANYLEIENWLNTNFPASEFAPNQLLKCEYMCKNYSADSLKNRRIQEYEPEVLETLAAQYSATTNEIFYYLGLKNQYEILFLFINNLLKKYSKNDLIAEELADLDNFDTLVTYDSNTDNFVSNEFSNFSQTDLVYLHSYIYQKNIIKVQYDEFTQRNFQDIPIDIINQFQPENLECIVSGRFFFKNINGEWNYFFYNGIDFCVKDTCSDCYSIIDLDFNLRECNPYKYVLEECDFFSPYDDDVSDVTVQSLEEPDIISDLFS